MSTFVELDPGRLSPWDLRVHIAEERAGGWTPNHFIPPGATDPVCQTYAGIDAGETYGFSSNREIWERWYAVGWGCQDCAEVLHS